MSRLRRFALAAMALVLAGAGTAWAAWLVLRPAPPDLDQAAAVAQAGQLDEAEALIRDALRHDPHSSQAHMLAAQILLNRPAPAAEPDALPDPTPALSALEHLDRVRPDNPVLAALVALYRGKAQYRLARHDDAERSWREALHIDPTVPEAGWHLLELYYLQERSDEARSLALRLHEVEPDPHDRVQLLLELVRQDAQPPSPESLALWFEPLARQSPGDLRVNLALGQALVRAGQADRGLEILHQTVSRHPDHPDAWDTWLTGLDEAGQQTTLARAVDRLPPELSATPRFAKHTGRVAQERGDWSAAVREYRRALREAPHDQRLKYRLARALRMTGQIDEAEQIEQEHQNHAATSAEVRSLYEQANAIKTLGYAPHPELYCRIAELRERMGRTDEARAWYRLALRDDPAHTDSLAALERLAAQADTHPGASAVPEPPVSDVRGPRHAP